MSRTPHSRSIFAVLQWVREQQAGSPRNKLVLMILAEHVDLGTLECYPKQATIARQAEVSESTVYRALKELETAGLVQQVSRPNGGAIVWRLLMDATATSQIDDSQATSQIDDSQRPVTRDDSDQSPVTTPKGTSQGTIQTTSVQQAEPVKASPPKKKTSARRGQAGLSKQERDTRSVLVDLFPPPSSATKKELGKHDGLLTAAAKEIAEAEAGLFDAEEIRARAKVARESWNVPLTANSLAGNWGKLGEKLHQPTQKGDFTDDHGQRLPKWEQEKQAARQATMDRLADTSFDDFHREPDHDPRQCTFGDGKPCGMCRLRIAQMKDTA